MRTLSAALDGITIGLAFAVGYHFGKIHVDLGTACPDFTQKARAAQVRALNIAEQAIGLGDQCRKELQACEAKSNSKEREVSKGM